MTPRRIVALLLCAALAASHVGALTTATHKPKKAAPRCAALTKTVRIGKSARTFKLPSCTNATAAATPTKAATVGGAHGVLAAAVATSTAYPCAIGNATCYCTWRAAPGYFADNDSAVACK